MRSLIFAALVLVVTACGDSVAETPSPASSSGVTTSLAPDVSTSTIVDPSAVTATTGPGTAPRPPTTNAPSTVTSSSTTGAVDEPTLVPPAPRPGSDGAAGSGCSPGAGSLPDGLWGGFVSNYLADAFDFDLICLYFGDIAWQKAAEVGEEAPNDVFISNRSATLRRIAVDGAAPVHRIVVPPDGSLTFEVSPYAGWSDDGGGYADCPGDFCLVWLHVNDGRVTEIVEQYLP